MSIIDKVQKQKLVYWAPTGHDEYGTPTHATGVEVKCRWDAGTDLRNAPDGSQFLPKHELITEYLLEIGGLVWLGALADWASDDPPKEGLDVHRIRSVATTPNMRNTQSLYEAFV